MTLTDWTALGAMGGLALALATIITLRGLHLSGANELGPQDVVVLAVAPSQDLVATPVKWRPPITLITTVRLAKTDRREAVTRLQNQQEAADSRRFTEELERADKRLADQSKAAEERLYQELTYSAAQFREERQVAQERDQLAEAYLVQVAVVRLPPARTTDNNGEPLSRAAAIVINSGRCAITRVQAELCMAESINGYENTEFFSSWYKLPAELRREGVAQPLRNSSPGTLTCHDLGMRYSTDDVAEKYLVGSYPIVRWQDHWGTWWEHKKGVVGQIKEEEP